MTDDDSKMLRSLSDAKPILQISVPSAWHLLKVHRPINKHDAHQFKMRLDALCDAKES